MHFLIDELTFASVEKHRWAESRPALPTAVIFILFKSIKQKEKTQDLFRTINFTQLC